MTTVPIAAIGVMSATAIGVVATMSAVAAMSKMAAVTATMTATMTMTAAVTATMTAAVTTVTHKRHHSGSGIAFQDRHRGCLCRRRYKTCGE
ncbi:MAG: hypothetical protein ACM3MH_03070 [Actinomycetota bacterium]